ncbi:hypothetical protein AGMMS49525_06380 [Bacteroidia bacterium]|nr:hypothetical protein AGMMS49525_06380 [Bacteroidia bacterium]
MNRFHSSLVIVLAAFFAACNDDFENYSMSPDDVLTFSTDTVAFDTIVSTIRTPFAAFNIRNTSSKKLLISSVSLEKGGNFKINVDGRAGDSFSDIEILAKDSLYVLVAVQPSENQSDIPTEILDRIVFVTNGVRQTVVLQAVAQDVEIRKEIRVTTDSTLNNAKPYLIYDSLVVQAGATLTVSAGSRLYMHPDAEIIVHGTLQLLGTEENPVTIRGDRFDQMVGIPYDRIPGQWGGIYFDSESYNNVIEYAQIRNGSYGLIFAESDPLQPKLTMQNSVLTNFKGMLLRATNCLMSIENCELSNARDGLLTLAGGCYTLSHCTLANYYFSGKAEYGWGNTKDATVFLHDNTQAAFENCIIWGANYNSTSRISFAEEAQNLHYTFRNCLFSNEATNDDPTDPDATIINCIIGEDPKFRIILSPDKNKAEFIYDFRLQEDSPALLPDGDYIGCYRIKN